MYSYFKLTNSNRVWNSVRVVFHRVKKNLPKTLPHQKFHKLESGSFYVD